MAKRCLKTIRLLAECFQAFEQYSHRHIRSLGLTAGQFDILATLGNTAGMTFKQLGEQTLITKGTLTGIIDRLELKGLVAREANQQDARSTRVCLTVTGQQLFEQVFPEHLSYCAQLFADCSEQDFTELEQPLRALQQRFRQGLELPLSGAETTD